LKRRRLALANRIPSVIKVPARPFLAPVFKKYGSDPEQVSKLMGGDYGGR